jgi:hypothetical protein
MSNQHDSYEEVMRRAFSWRRHIKKSPIAGPSKSTPAPTAFRVACGCGSAGAED